MANHYADVICKASFFSQCTVGAGEHMQSYDNYDEKANEAIIEVLTSLTWPNKHTRLVHRPVGVLIPVD